MVQRTNTGLLRSRHRRGVLLERSAKGERGASLVEQGDPQACGGENGDERSRSRSTNQLPLVRSIHGILLNESRDLLPVSSATLQIAQVRAKRSVKRNRGELT